MKPSGARSNVRIPGGETLKGLLTLIVLLSLNLGLSTCGGGGGGGGGPVDTTPPVTSAFPAAGIYGSTQSVTLASNETATIYYSLDGTFPSIGGANTLSGPSPVTGIQISNDTTLLQFFAVDTSGNHEATKSEMYLVNAGTSTGPGDAQNYFPINQGNCWSYQVTSPTYSYTSTQITGTKVINGVTAVVSRGSNPGITGIPLEEYLLKSSNGIAYLGNNDQTDKLTPQFIPYQAVHLPLQPGAGFVQTNKAGLDYGEDLDLDGKNETCNLNSLVTVKGFETVTVPAGTFANCVRIETDLTLAVTLSASGTTITVESVQTQWFAPDIGPVKSVTDTTGDGISQKETEELTGSIIAATFFGPATHVTTSSIPTSLAVADFNADGKLDMVVTNEGNPSLGYAGSGVSVLLGDGNGSFGPANNFLAGTFPISVAVGDFNGDGKQDLAVANFGSANVSILLGNGNGTFGAATNIALAAQMNPTSVAVGDFNGDGKLDLAVAIGFGFSNATPGYASILLGNGDGTFGAATNFAVGGAPRSVAVGDFNGDGKLDLAVANSLSSSVSILLGAGNGSFSAATNFNMGNTSDSPTSLLARDFNGDGKLDLAVANTSSSLNDSNVSILLGTGTGSFGTPTRFVVDSFWGGYLHSVAAGDFNGDGKLDLAVAKERSGAPESSNNISILFGDGTGFFGSAIHFVTTEGGPTFVATGDFNGDGKPDMAVTTDAVSIFLNNTP